MRGIVERFPGADASPPRGIGPTFTGTTRATPAEKFPPSDYIREEMDARGWRVEDLAEQADWTTALTSEVLAGRKVTRLIAYGLAQAFGTSLQLWTNLQEATHA
jgi:plasmid maintenance system antidote protein VapI